MTNIPTAMMYPIWILSNEDGANMGLISKLKNVLFEEEEVEEEKPVKEETSVKEPAKKKEPVKMTFDADDEEDLVSDRELFKAEPTFNFPAFDEHEFEEVKKEETIDVPNYEKTQEAKGRVKPVSVMDVERGRTRSDYRYDYKESYASETKEYPRKPREKIASEPATKRKFVPSPVISPVYGVLDKNYRKEDIVVRGEEKKTIDVDSVRKKAFGTLEDDIEKTLSTSSKDFYKEEKTFEEPKDKKLEELLNETAEEIIPVHETKKASHSFNIEEESVKKMPKRSDELEVLDRPVKKSIEEKLEDETLENDLFDLIDSMYETREDGE